MRDITLFSPHSAEYERLAESMGMDLQAFKLKYLTDPPFHALVVVHFAQERELLVALDRLVQAVEGDLDYGLAEAVESAKVLLAQPVAGEEKERG